MLAPPGPLSAEALRFTLVRPLVGPCTTICVSTVSPRALDNTMEEVVPAAAVLLTRTMLGDTHTGNAALAGCTPVPLTATTAGEFAALLLTVMLPFMAPVIVGAKITLRGVLCPGFRTVPAEAPTALSSRSDAPTFEIVSAEFPVFVSVTLRELVPLIFTFPK